MVSAAAPGLQPLAFLLVSVLSAPSLWIAQKNEVLGNLDLGCAFFLFPPHAQLHYKALMTLTRAVRRRFKLTLDLNSLIVLTYLCTLQISLMRTLFLCSFGKMANLEMFACSSYVLINTSEMSVSQSSCVTVCRLVAV